MIEIDGSYGEGGGQILRTALALSAVFKEPCFIFNIRKNRENPGLAMQHLVGMRALAELYNAKLEGDKIGSKEIIFEPSEVFRTDLEVKIETAGSITLVLQMLLLPALLSGKKVKIKFKGGATDTFFAPKIDYFRYVFLPMLEKIISILPNHKDGKLEIDILRRGFYPKGEAEVENHIFPINFFQKAKEFNLTKRGELKKILIISGASNSLRERKVAERQLSGAHQTPLFYKKAHLPLETKIEYYDSPSAGSQVTIIGEFENSVLGTSILGKPEKSSEEVGKEAAMKFLKETKGKNALDSHLTDQILPYLAIFTKSAKIVTSEITKHTKTNTWVIEKFTQYQNKISGAGFIKGKFEIEGNLIKWYS